MAKLRSDPTGISDLLEYIETASDFSFELRVLELLTKYGIESQHSGSYEDPVTRKTREFDIRAEVKSKARTLRLAIECKNIGLNFPVLVSRVPRSAEESYHEVARMTEATVQFGDVVTRAPMLPRSEILRIRGPHSLYGKGDLVGKSTVQVGRAPGRDGGLVTGDTELYEKWGQALASLGDLVRRMYWDDAENVMYGCAIPIVVVPDGSLWSVDYRMSGERAGDPYQTDRCSCYVNRDYEMGDGIARAWYWVSHVEIMTFKGLKQFVESYLYHEDQLKGVFPVAGIHEARSARR